MKTQYDPLYLDGKELGKVQTHCQLGIIFNDKMTWDDHIRSKCTAAMKRVTLLKQLALRVPRTTKLVIYTSFVRPVLEYGSVLFDNCSQTMSDMIERVQRQAALAITGAYAHTNHVNLLRETGLSLLSIRRTVSKIILIFKIIRNLTPSYLKSLLPDEENVRYNTRNAGNLRLPKISKNYFLKSFIPSSIRLWNGLETIVKSILDLEEFKKAIKQMYTPNTLYKPYLWGYTKEFINLSRLRMGLSGLNAHRKRYHFIDYSTCPKCHAKKEDSIHYLLQCPAYAVQRAELITSLQQLLPEVLFTNASRRSQIDLVNKIISGINQEGIDLQIFETASQYIKSTERFI